MAFIMHDDVLDIESMNLSNNRIIDNFDDWSKRYRDEGFLWGKKPSKCAQTLINMLNPNSQIIELGCGYGRDTKTFLEHGHDIEAFDKAEIGITKAQERLEEYITAKRASIIHGDFLSAQITKDSFDAAFSHRTLHLIDPNLAPKVIERLSNVLNSGGLLVLSARCPLDFNEKQMEWVNTKESNDNYTTAIYKNRESHLINFYDESRLTKLLRGHFTDLTFEHGEELESCNNIDKTGKHRMSKYIVVTARKKNLLQIKNL